MNYKVEIIPHCKRKAKKLVNKYPSFKKEYEILIDSLTDEPMQGIPLGNDCYKIKIAIRSKGKGKSAGARFFTHVIAVREKVYLLIILDKSDEDNISDKELKDLIKQIT